MLKKKRSGCVCALQPPECSKTLPWGMADEASCEHDGGSGLSLKPSRLPSNLGLKGCPFLLKGVYRGT